MRKTLVAIEREIRSIKKRLLQIDEMRPGSLTSQHHERPNDRNYIYYQLSYTHNTKSRTNYIKKEFVEDVEKQIENYKLFKSLSKRWVDLAIQHSKLKIDVANKKR